MTRATFLKSIAAVFGIGATGMATTSESKKFCNPVPISYTDHEGGQWLSWKWEGIHPEILREIPRSKETPPYAPRINVGIQSSTGEMVYINALRFKSGAEWDIYNGWRTTKEMPTHILARQRIDQIAYLKEVEYWHRIIDRDSSNAAIPTP